MKHGPRNSDIATYVSAAEYLVARGYTVFRMGSEVKDSLKSFSPKIIDYASNGMRTEFLDLYLGAHCAFSISTASGWDEIPVIFKRPIMYVNTVPQVNVHLLTRSALVYPKRTIDLKSQQPMSLREDLNRAKVRATLII